MEVLLLTVSAPAEPLMVTLSEVLPKSRVELPTARPLLRTFREVLLLRNVFSYVPLTLVKKTPPTVKLASTMLLIFEGTRAPAPPPGVESAEALCEAAALKNTVLPGTGAIPLAQLRASDQLVLLWPAMSAPVQTFTTTGPAVITSWTALASPLSTMLPV